MVRVGVGLSCTSITFLPAKAVLLLIEEIFVTLSLRRV